jgi:hypothetical protein
MLGAWSSSRSSGVSGSPACSARGILIASSDPTTKTIDAMISEYSGPRRADTPAAGSPPIAAARTLMSASRELASTSSPSSRTNPGTSELLAIDCAFANTSTPNARG